MANNKNGNRIERLNAEFKRAIYEVISKNLKNPLITEMFSILDVDVSKDLKNAKVYVSVFSVNEAKKKATFDAIVKSAPRIRYYLAQIMRIRTVPELRFIMDGSMEYGDKMDKLFLEIHKGEK